MTFDFINVIGSIDPYFFNQMFQSSEEIGK